MLQELTSRNRDWVSDFIKTRWGSEYVVTHGRKLYPVKLPGFFSVDENNNVTGLVTYEIRNDECEIVTLDATEPHKGIGTLLLKKVVEVAGQQRCSRVWCITTNDNLDAFRFYQRRGFSIVTIHRNAIEASRKIKPSIPLYGNYNIAIADEIQLEHTIKQQ